LPETELALADNDDHEDAVAGAHRITNPFDSFARAEWNPSCIAEDLINAASSDKLPVRHLQHGKLMDLFWQFLAWFGVLKDIAAHQYRCPSWSTFAMNGIVGGTNHCDSANALNTHNAITASNAGNF